MIKYRKRHDGLYECTESYWYCSTRYGKRVHIIEGQVRDGASGAMDIKSSSWWVHDQLCADACWSDQTPVTAWQCAQVLSDILWDEGRKFRSVYWKWTTLFFGCKRPRENGWFNV